MPPILFLLQNDEVESLDGSLCLFDPLKDKLKGAILGIKAISLESWLTRHAVTPSHRPLGQVRVFWTSPVARVLLTYAPVENKFFIEVSVLSNQVDSVSVEYFFCNLELVFVIILRIAWLLFLDVAFSGMHVGELGLSVLFRLLVCPTFQIQLVLRLRVCLITTIGIKKVVDLFFLLPHFSGGSMSWIRSGHTCW